MFSEALAFREFPETKNHIEIQNTVDSELHCCNEEICIKGDIRLTETSDLMHI